MKPVSEMTDDEIETEFKYISLVRWNNPEEPRIPIDNGIEVYLAENINNGRQLLRWVTMFNDKFFGFEMYFNFDNIGSFQDIHPITHKVAACELIHKVREHYTKEGNESSI